VFVCANQHLNPTNVCILRATCTFCSFARTPREDGAYTMTLEEAFHEASMASDTPVREFHIVGGLHPRLRLSYYEDLIRGLKERHPGVEIKALTAVEIAHLARIEKTSVEDVLIRLREAGHGHHARRRRGGLREGRPRDDRAAQAGGGGMDRRAPSRARPRHPHELHHAVRPRRVAAGPRGPPASCCATCRTRRAAS
jgi:hypothetical protein